MAKKSLNKSPKEPIRLRAKKLASGAESLYLDCYYDGKRSYEFLKLYLVPETSAAARQRNAATLNSANTIKLKRILKLTNDKAGLKNTSLKARMTLAAWMEEYKTTQAEKGVKDSKLISNAIHAIKTYDIDIPMYRINREWLVGLIAHLRNDYRSKNGAQLKAYTIINYMAVLRNALNMAVREEVLPDNPMMRLTVQDKVKAPESKREFLTVEELARLEEAPNSHEYIKQAFLFGCYCGLRISDIRKITWGQFTDDNGQCRLHIVMHKTKNPVYLPISKKALQWLPERDDAKDDEQVFPDLPRDVSTKKFLQDWLDAAGITKHITFHCSRHTFATMMLTLGADIYTVSKLLGHTKVETTQIYAKIVNKKKDDAVSLIDKAFE